MEQEKRYWNGTIPEKDDFGYPIKNAFVDGRTYTGSWAIMTPANYRFYGTGKYGQGIAQYYRLEKSTGKFLKVKG